MSRSRNFVFTINNFEEEDLDYLLSLGEPLPNGLKWIVCGLEVGEAGTPHVQGACSFSNAKTNKAAAKAILPNRPNQCHVDQMRGTRWEARQYIADEEKTGSMGWWEEGTTPAEDPEEDKKSNWQRCWQLVVSGSSTADLMMNSSLGPTATAMRTSLLALEMEVKRRNAKRWREVQTTVLFGSAGSGKTRKAMESCIDLDWFKMDHPGGHLVWWDGYIDQDILILDDFTGWIPLTQLLQILDGHPMILNVKNGRAMANWTKVIITSNQHPRDWYRPEVLAMHDDGRALKRRLNQIIHMTDDGESELAW